MEHVHDRPPGREPQRPDAGREPGARDHSRPEPARTVTAPVSAPLPAAPRPAAAPAGPPWPVLYRRRSGRILAGVAGGLADHLGVRVLWVRVAFVALCALGGTGLMAYALLWVFVPQRDDDDRPAADPERRQALGLLALGIGLAIASSSISGAVGGWVTAPVALAIVGAVVVWREADEAQRRRWRSGARTGVAGVLLGGGGWTATVRVVAGAALVATGIGAVALQSETLGPVPSALIAILATLVGVAVLTVPFWLRLARDLGDERRERIRTQERAEIAAHLHDSVLQTLALIQKQSADPREVVRLARGQERQLRSWLYGASGQGVDEGSGRFADALALACGEVEDTFALSVQQVVVGDTDLDERTHALVQAAREAVVNAAKHAGVAEVSVYAEVEPARVTVFVRDRGTGFDPARVPADRHGLADSIRGRMERNGGTCVLRTAVGEGTEVRLEMPLVAREAARE